MIRISLGHFLCQPHMSQACTDWNKKHPKTGNTATWAEFKTFFINDMKQYKKQQKELRAAGIANSAVTSSKVDNLESHVAFLTTQLHELAELTHSKAAEDHPPALVAAANSIGTSTLSTNPDVLSLIADLATKVSNISSTASNNGNRTNKHKTRHRAPEDKSIPRLVRRFDTNTYCWSHGFDLHPHHCSKTCRHKKPGHQDEATYKNMMGGSQQYCQFIT